MKIKSKLSISLLAVSAIGIGGMARYHFVPQAPSPWPSFVADYSHTGNSNSGGVHFAAYNTSLVSSVGTNFSSPVLTQGSFTQNPYGWRGALVVGDNSGIVHCIQISLGGTQSWTYTTGGAVEATPLTMGIASTADQVYVGSDDNYFYRISNAPVSGPQGTLIARYQTGGAIRSSAAGNAVDQLVYFGSDDFKVYGLSTINNGLTLDWSFSTGGVVESSPAIDSANCYVGSDDGKFYAIHRFGTSKGTAAWSYNVGSVIRSSPTLNATVGSVTFGARDHYVYSLTTAGVLKWRFLTGGNVDSSPTQSGSNIFVGSDDGSLYCLNASTGALVWSLALGSAIKTAPAVCNDGTVMVSTDTDGVYNVSAAGVALHHFSAGVAIKSSPAIGRTDQIANFTQRAFYVTNAGSVFDIK